MKTIIKDIIPPIFLKLKRKFFPTKEYEKITVSTHGWFGDYNSWQEAKSASGGYDDGVILEKVKNAVLKVKNNEVAFERDSVLFNKPEYSWPLLANLLKIAVENKNELNIIDFGGSLGSTYFQNKNFLSGLATIKWSVVEQAHFVDCGTEFIADEILKFYKTINETISACKPNVLLLSSVLQYLPEPYEFIKEVLSYNFDYIIFDRTAFIERDKDLLTIQIVPETIYTASYPSWFFNYDKFIESFKQKYNVINTFSCNITQPILIERQKAYWMGIILKKNEIS